MVDWQECIKKNIVKEISIDDNKIRSIIDIARHKIESADYLPGSHHISKITLLYDALRELLEARAIKEGYKIYDPECYTAFLREIVGNSQQADDFDKLRKIRNGINYYGRSVSFEEAEIIIQMLKGLILAYNPHNI